MPETTSGTFARIVVPDEKVTEPAGAAVPLDGLTVAVKTVVALVAITAGAAATEVAVATTGSVTLTVLPAVELAKLPVA